jgi:hypothetical protein
MRARTSRRSIAALVAVTALAVAGCSDSSTAEGGQPVQGTATAGAASALKGVCPDTVVFQTNWWPQAEYGGIYRLLGANPTIDSNKNKVTGKLVDNGVDTGVQIEIRSGGPANNFTPSASLLYTDDSIMFGGSDLEANAQISGTGKPVLSVFAPLDLSPVVLLWDPAQHPDFKTIADIGATNTKVVYFQGSTYMSYLTGSGLLRSSQVSASYTGTPDQWKAAKGNIVQQGYVTNEVIRYQNDPSVWGKKVQYQLVADSGYPTYTETMAIRPDRKARLGPCLKKVVPMLQRATAAYSAEPASTNKFISELVSKFPKAFPYSTEQANAAAKAMKDNAIIGNGKDTTVGNFEEARVQRIITIVTPIFAAQKTPVKQGLTVGDLVTNDFIDPSVGVK